MTLLTIAAQNLTFLLFCETYF